MATDMLYEFCQTGTYFTHLPFHPSSLFPFEFCFGEL